MVARRQQERVEKYIALGQEEGARVVVGGNGMPDGLDRGWYVRPTVFADVDNSMRIAREEIFGPVLSVIPFDDVDDAIRIANDSDLGLGGSAWTADPAEQERFLTEIETGMIYINHFTESTPEVPFGGAKNSGYGRELAEYGPKAFVNAKTVWIAGN
jgi:aldehyde dehydrogenase (NAD+)